MFRRRSPANLFATTVAVLLVVVTSCSDDDRPTRRSKPRLPELDAPAPSDVTPPKIADVADVAKTEAAVLASRGYSAGWSQDAASDDVVWLTAAEGRYRFDVPEPTPQWGVLALNVMSDYRRVTVRLNGEPFFSDTRVPGAHRILVRFFSGRLRTGAENTLEFSAERTSGAEITPISTPTSGSNETPSSTVSVPRLGFGGLELNREKPPVVGLEAMKHVPRDWLASLADVDYRFVVAGHVYGRHKPITKGLFAPFKAAWIRDADARHAAFSVFTGDMVAKTKPDFFIALQKDLIGSGLPALAAPGNHDSARTPKQRFALLFDRTRVAWNIGRDHFVACNLNDTGGHIDGVDLEALKKAVAAKPRSIFVFVHPLVWIDHERTNKKLVPRRLSNTIRTNLGYAEKGRFYPEIVPLLEQSGAHCFVIAGDVGAGAKVVESWEKIGDRIHLISSGMGEHADVGTWLVVEMGRSGIRIIPKHLAQTRLRHIKGVERIPRLWIPSR